MFIYLVTNKINGKQYVGQTTKDVNKRIRQHLTDKTYIGRALRQYGIESFEISVIDSATVIDVLKEKEKYWIKFYDCKVPNGYNLTDGGDGGLGHIVSQEAREKLSKAMKGNQLRLGCSFSEETKARMKMVHKGHLGTPHTEGFKAKLIGNKYAQGNKGKPLSKEHKKKIGEALIGNQNGIHSIEGRMKMFGNKYAQGRKSKKSSK